jgi:hypothetical protein
MLRKHLVPCVLGKICPEAKKGNGRRPFPFSNIKHNFYIVEAFAANSCNQDCTNTEAGFH